jgi:hypothetical protein
MTPQFAAVRAALHVVEVGCRRTGRTERLLQSLKPGMRVLCPSEREARRLQIEARGRGITDVEFRGVNPCRDPRESMQIMARRCPTVVTEDWLYEYWRHCIESAETNLSAALDHISGVHIGLDRPPHPETAPPGLSEYILHAR